MIPAACTPRPLQAGLLAGLVPSVVATAESAGSEPAAGPAFFPAGQAVAPGGLLPGDQVVAPGALFPASQAVAGSGLFPAEQAVVATAGPRRRAEFAAGRLCARAALARLGLPAVPVLAGRAGQPQWPAGVTGSITHCAGYRACAVALAADVAAIGIDAEPDAGLAPGLIESLAGGAERAWIARQAASAPTVHWDRLLFSAKEAVAKLWYPLTGQWLGFRRAAIFPAAAGTFDVHVTGQGYRPATCLTGRWLARGGLIVTAVTWTPADTGRDGPAVTRAPAATGRDGPAVTPGP